MKRAGILILALLLAFPARAGQDIVADLSSASVAVTSGFAGTRLTVFGALDPPIEDGDDLIVALRGPDRPVSVRQRQRRYGLWVNGQSVAFDHAPAFYALAATRPPAQLAAPEELAAHGLAFEAAGRGDVYADALLRLQRARGLYNGGDGRVSVQAGRLFRADFALPANLPIGAYQVRVALLHQGAVAAERLLPFAVGQAGAEALLRRAMRDSPFLYALLTLAAMLALGAASALLSRGED